MSTTPKSSGATPAKKGGAGRIILLILVLLLLGGNLGLYFYLNKEQKIVEEQTVTIELANQRVDSLTNELETVRQDLQARYDEIAKLGGDTARLSAQIAQLEVDIKKAKANRAVYYKKWKELEELVNSYKTTITEKDNEIAQLKSERDKLAQEVTNLQTKIATRDDSINALALEKEKLDQKVQKASKLFAKGIKVTYLDKKGKEVADEKKGFKAKKVAKLKVAIQLVPNEVSEVETKEVYLRVIEPGGATISDLSQGGGTFADESGKELVYTQKSSFLFDNRNSPPPFIFEKGDYFSKGVHKVEVYIAGNKIGDAEFTVR